MGLFKKKPAKRGTYQRYKYDRDRREAHARRYEAAKWDAVWDEVQREKERAAEEWWSELVMQDPEYLAEHFAGVRTKSLQMKVKYLTRGQDKFVVKKGFVPVEDPFEWPDPDKGTYNRFQLLAIYRAELAARERGER
jgi:hypothetical protein